MITRKLTLFQKVVIVNSLLISQIWYRAQTYPLSQQWVNKINKILCKFIWGSANNPIKHEIMTLGKREGGMSLINIEIKAKCIFACRILKQFLIDKKQHSLLLYYIAMRLNPIFNIRSLPINIGIVSTPYFEEGIAVIRSILHLKGFPNINSKSAYQYLLERNVPTVQQRYPFSNWKNIWLNMNFRYIPVRTREILFKYLHGILPNKYRLKQIRISASDLCDVCGVPETNIHMMYQCQEISAVKDFLVRLFAHFEFYNVNMAQLIMLDLPKVEKKLKNTLIFVASLYIASIWFGRSRKHQILSSLKACIIRERRILEEILQDKLIDLFIEPFCSLNKDNIERI